MRSRLGLLGLLLACGGAEGAEVSDALEAYCQTDAAEVEGRVDALLAVLTPDQKFDLMSGERATLYEGVWLAAQIEEQGVPGLRMLDGPRGLSAYTELPGTSFPVGAARGATWDPALEERVGAAMGRELRAAGGDVLLAPTINILRHPRWGRTQETYGEDVHHLGAMGVAFIEGVQSEGVLASAKHYAVNSIDDTRFEVDVNVDERTLREIYLPHFRRAVQDAQVGSVMSAYNFVNGVHCSEHDHLLREILKGEWEFQGFVESDWLLGTRDTVGAANGGLDIEMPAANHFTRRRLRAAVEEGSVSMDTVDEAARRVLRAQLCFGLDARPATRDPASLPMDEHHALAREVAERSLVLLKNEGALPLESGASIALVGPLADAENIGDLGSSSVMPPYVVTPLQGLEEAGADVALVDVEDADAMAAADVVVVVVGLTADDEGEGGIAAGDRDSLALPREQSAIVAAAVAANENVVVVLEGSGPVLMPWLDDVSSVLMAWYPGMEGGHAIARVLLGEVNPSGRLPQSWPVAEEDLPAFDNESLAVTYDYWHGYRHLEREGTAPLFPFGFGLSYTSFAYGELQAEVSGEDLVARVEVTNSGERAGIETVQLYVSVEGSAVMRAPQDLRAFVQVSLEPGASGSAELRVPLDDLRYWSEEGWALEPGTYVLRAGSSSQDAGAEARVTL